MSTLPSWGSHLQKGVSTGAPLCGARTPEHTLNIKMQQMKGMKFSQRGVLTLTDCTIEVNMKPPYASLVSSYRSTPPSDPTLSTKNLRNFFFILIPFFVSIHTSSSQTICLFSHIDPLPHTSLMLFPTSYQSHTSSSSPLPPSPSSVSLSSSACYSVLPWRLPFPL